MRINIEKDNRFGLSGRYSPEVLADGFAPIPMRFLEHYHDFGISSSEAMLIIHLLSHRWDDTNPFPTFARLAKRMGMTETAVRNHARSLEKKFLIKRILRSGRSNEFDLSPLLDRLKAIPAKPGSKSNHLNGVEVQ